ncbi:single-stranded DNA-binding protein [Parasulfuritortus cantonensis]|uniref:Single-stranded DNA-binding protein n=1 Tax=Parasulfuritortus cantonensis TaxID=2528202 RepID=A0A4R1BDK5_9PROT|nr:single-stranded DNA-binding protein [Parasulfuritortus cantonensis]TCJ15196.1 single-stranded DNA-binding protein [Parasulfuritortus cantonensis]
MGNEFRGTGNLGAAPVLKMVAVKGEDRPVCELRVFFDEYSRDAKGEIQQSGGFWLTGSVWDRRAEATAKLLRKGARVRVEGRLKEESWADKDTGEEKSEFRLVIDDVFLALSRIESVTFKEKSGAGEASDNQE